MVGGGWLLCCCGRRIQWCCGDSLCCVVHHFQRLSLTLIFFFHVLFVTFVSTTGFNNIKERIPPTLHLGKEQNVMRLTELLRFELAGAGFIEALTFGLMAEREAYAYLNRPNDGNSCVKMSNPMDENNEIVRPALLPGLLKTIACNREVGVAKGESSVGKLLCFLAEINTIFAVMRNFSEFE